MIATQCLDKPDVEDKAVAENAGGVRVEKVRRVRRQVGQGRYRINERLDVVIDRILAELLV